MMKMLARILAATVGFQPYLARVEAQQKVLKSVRDEASEPIYDFYRCNACHRLLTKLEEFETFDPTSSRFGQVCPCGYRRYSPTNMTWNEWLLPRVWKFAFVRILEVA